MDSEHVLYLHNDDEHSFDYVVEALMEVCLHNSDQAEQCACLAHYKGKYDVKFGTYFDIISMQEQLYNKGLKVSVQSIKTVF